jgi:hypothetical protein
MFLALSLGDARLASTSAGDWSGLEHLTWKWRVVLQTCVTKERTLHDLVNLLCAEHVVGAGGDGAADDAERLRACYARYNTSDRRRVFTGRLITDAAIDFGGTLTRLSESHRRHGDDQAVVRTGVKSTVMVDVKDEEVPHNCSKELQRRMPMFPLSVEELLPAPSPPAVR